ncbi:S-adenosyl-L-methionine-dependent methyltransferase [Gigaspora rosea]|uniref:S-adenosyl-L-methionine-dependent methyltransferase n=1 Tax=Gigaspora rosea TaxID=44941 RepID=A0A397W5Q9_9GLOM|nr:S-adenosyl-L-methionine-dependent methyltransferase [Gigaspora rosea]
MGNKISHRIIKRKNAFRTNSYPSRDSNTISTGYNDSSNSQLVPQLKTVAGRPYFEENFSTYIFPADWEEADRLQALHFSLKHILDGNYSAPLSNIIKPGSKILDIGCGPGHWSFEIAQEYPYAEVYGIDILSSFPNKIKPKNCHFKTCDILEGLPFNDNEFDYIFMRHMVASIKAYQWFSVLKDIKRVLKSGGIIESVELNCTPHSIGPVHTQFMKLCNDAMSDAFDIDLKLKFEPMFKDLGFQNVTFTSKYISLGNWGANAGKIGQIWTTNTVQMAEAVKSILLPHMKLTDDEWDRMFKTMYFDEVDKYRSYQEHYIVLATKV